MNDTQAAPNERQSNDRRPMRGLLVGCGYISTQQLEAWSRIGEADIVALVDPDQTKARAQATRFEIQQTYDSLGSALDAQAVDFVDVATPPQTHLELTRLCAQAGVHVLCQKPLAPSLEEIDEMIEVTNRAGVQLVANENMRFQPWYRKMKQLLEPGPIGKPFYARIDSRSRGTLPTVGFVNQPYFATMPRLVIYEMVVHFFDTMRYLFGEPETLAAATGRASTEVAGEDHASVLVQYSDLIAVMDISWASIPTYATDDAMGWAVTTVEGLGGTMQLTIDGKLRVITDHAEEVFEFGPETVFDGFVNMQRRFIECVTAGIECETSGRQYAKTMELVFGSYVSARDHVVYRIGEDRGDLR